MKIEVIIPTYNSSELIKRNLPEILKACSSRNDITISIVDDGSKTNDREDLKSFIDEIRKTSDIKIDLKLFEKNVGFSSNINRAGLESDSDLLIFLNSDAVPEKDFLKYLLPHFENDKLFGVGMMDKSIEGEKIVLRGRGIAYWRRGMFLHKKGEVDKETTSWISGGSSIVRTALFKKFGGFNKLYNPFYWEDIDLSYIVRKSGYSILFEPKSIVIHKHFEGAIKKHYKDKRITEISYRNQFIFIWKNITDTKLVLSHMLFLPMHIIKAILRFDIEFLKGFLLAVIILPDIMRSRNKTKKVFILQDKEIIP